MSTIRRRRLVGVFALGFAVLFFTNMVLTNVPDIGESNADAESFYAITSNQIQAVAAFYVLVAALICLVSLLAVLLPPVRALGADGLVSAAWAVAAAFIGLHLAGGAAFLVPSATVALGFTESAAVDPVFARSMSMWGDALLLLAGPVALGGCLALACRAARLTKMLPRWVAGFGYGVAFLLVLGGWTWFPLPLAVLWAMTAGVRLLLPTGNVGTESGLVVRTDAVPSTAR